MRGVRLKGTVKAQREPASVAEHLDLLANMERALGGLVLDLAFFGLGGRDELVICRRLHLFVRFVACVAEVLTAHEAERGRELSLTDLADDVLLRRCRLERAHRRLRPLGLALDESRRRKIPKPGRWDRHDIAADWAGK